MSQATTNPTGTFASAHDSIDMGPGAPHGDGHGAVAHQFEDAHQQKDAATLGMWAFLATEVMFFGGALLAYAIYRNAYHAGFAAASRLEDWRIGALNTGVLLCSSLTMALAVHAAHAGSRKWIIRWMLITIALASVFIGVKVYEYSHLIHEHLVPLASAFDPHFKHVPLRTDPPGQLDVTQRVRDGAQIFFSIYFVTTSLHALHMIVGIGVMLFVINMARRGRFSREYYNPVEMTGLYWHFVDIVWIFLYPLLYLIDRAN